MSSFGEINQNLNEETDEYLAAVSVENGKLVGSFRYDTPQLHHYVFLKTAKSITEQYKYNIHGNAN